MVAEDEATGGGDGKEPGPWPNKPEMSPQIQQLITRGYGNGETGGCHFQVQVPASWSTHVESIIAALGRTNKLPPGAIPADRCEDRAECEEDRR